MNDAEATKNAGISWGPRQKTGALGNRRLKQNVCVRFAGTPSEARFSRFRADRAVTVVEEHLALRRWRKWSSGPRKNQQDITSAGMSMVLI